MKEERNCSEKYELFNHSTEPHPGLLKSEPSGIVLVQKSRCTEMFQHACFPPKDFGHDLANEEHDPHICVTFDPRTDITDQQVAKFQNGMML